MKLSGMLNGSDTRSHRGAERRDQRIGQSRRAANLFRYWRKTVAALVLGSALAAPLAALAVSGPFAEFTGTWSGNGTIRVEGGATERIRCIAAYQPRAANELAARLRCASITTISISQANSRPLPATRSGAAGWRAPVVSPDR